MIQSVRGGNSTAVKLDMDWTTPLRALQADFLERLQSGCLLHCKTQGQHSELTVISGERLKRLRDFCWGMAEKYKRNSPVRKVFIDNMKGKLGEEVGKLRFFTTNGELVLTEAEDERQQKELAQQRADRLAAKLRELSINPDRL